MSAEHTSLETIASELTAFVEQGEREVIISESLQQQLLHTRFKLQQALLEKYVNDQMAALEDDTYDDLFARVTSLVTKPKQPHTRPFARASKVKQGDSGKFYNTGK